MTPGRTPRSSGSSSGECKEGLLWQALTAKLDPYRDENTIPEMKSPGGTTDRHDSSRGRTDQMDEFRSVDDILDFAIGKEQDAADLYKRMAGQADGPATKKLFLELEKEELMHKARLKAMKKGKELVRIAPNISDLKIGDYLTEAVIKPGMSYQDGLIYGMQTEKAEFRLYMDLSAQTDDENLRNLLLTLANEEAQHKLRLELEYDEFVLTEN